MPRTRGFTAEQKLDFQRKKIADTCAYHLIRTGVKRKQVAKLAGISPAALSCQFKSGRMSLDVLIAVLSLTDPDAAAIKNMLTVSDLKDTDI